ncbi:MAG: hypothetical protein O3B95_00980 [Chloroflexi bacterium]|nr:hypothetical protein [Chloroflexota bacterium]
MQVDSWYAETRRRWAGKAEWLAGEGQYAVLEHCRVLTVHLYTTQIEAAQSKQLVDEAGCGLNCVGTHEMIDLDMDSQAEVAQR